MLDIVSDKVVMVGFVAYSLLLVLVFGGVGYYVGIKRAAKIEDKLYSVFKAVRRGKV